MAPDDAPASALDIAAAIVERRPGLDQMQLHKLLYLIQAAYLAWFGEPAFRQRVEAWKYGPMVRGVAGSYMQFGRLPIMKPMGGNSEQISDRLSWVIDRILQRYGDLSGPELARLTKIKDGPWRQVRGDLPATEPSDEEIPKELMRGFHRRSGVTPETLTEEESELAQRFLEGDAEALADLFQLATGQRPSVTPG